MKPLRFYEHFACAYGTIWLVLLVCSFLIQKHIDAGAFGLFGFPIIALVYAFIRKAGQGQIENERAALLSEILELRAALRVKNQDSE